MGWYDIGRDIRGNAWWVAFGPLLVGYAVRILLDFKVFLFDWLICWVLWGLVSWGVSLTWDYGLWVFYAVFFCNG